MDTDLKQHKRRSLPVNNLVFLYLIGFVLILIMILWLLQIVFLDYIYKEIKETEIKKISEAVADNFKNPDIQNILDYSQSQRDVSISAIDSKGRVILSNVNFPNDILTSSINPDTYARLYSEAEKQDGATYYIDDSMVHSYNTVDRIAKDNPIMKRRKMSALVCTRAVTDSSGRNLLLLAYSFISPVNSTVDTLKHEFFFITVLLILLSALMAVIISKKVTAPISDVNKSAKVLATGNYETVFDGSGFREIEELSETLNQATVQLSKVDRVSRELIANVSHDLRTPLTMITGYAEVMRDIPGEYTPENVQIIIDESKRLTNLVNDVMDVSNLSSGAVPVSCSKVCITKTITRILERYKKLCDQQHYIIEFEHSGKVDVIADEGKISQVIYNLINNAIHYCGTDRKIIIRQTIGADDVRIDVIDHGIGISKDDLPYIWDRYFKSKQIHKRAVVGTGLGLSIVKNILELHGCSYGAESHEGEGSDFWFILKQY